MAIIGHWTQGIIFCNVFGIKEYISRTIRDGDHHRSMYFDVSTIYFLYTVFALY